MDWKWKWKWGEFAAWRFDVLNEAAALEEALNRVRAAPRVASVPHDVGGAAPPASSRVEPDSPVFEVVSTSIEEDIATVRTAAEPETGVRRAIASWWTGTGVENAWRAAHRAGQNLLLIETPNPVRAQLADMEWQVETTFDKTDTRHNKFLKILDDARTRLDHEQVAGVRRVRDVLNDLTFANLRRFRNTVLKLAFGAFFLGSLLVALNAIHHGLVPVCSTTTVNSKSVSTCLSNASNGSARWTDTFTIATLGALGGLIAAARSLSRLKPSFGPYNVVTAQAVLKVPMGMVTGIFGSVLLANKGLGLEVSSAGQLAAYAGLFGYAQQAFTRSVENRANALLSGTPSKEGPPAQKNAVADR